MRVPEYHGSFYDFEGLVVDPCAVQEHVPIWIGGRTLAFAPARGRARRRLVPVRGQRPSEAAEWLQRVDVPSGFEVVLPPTAVLTPINEPSKTQEILGDTAALGATIILSGFASESLEHYLEQLEALAAVHARL